MVKTIPLLENGVGVASRRHRLSRAEFERRYIAMPDDKKSRIN